MRFLLCVAVLFCATTTIAQSPDRAKVAYESQLAKLEKGYKEAIKRYDAILEKERAKAKAKYVEQLDFARKSALIKNNLDEAQRLAEAKKALEIVKEPAKPSESKSHLWFVGTEWKDGSWIRKWNKNNYDCSTMEPGSRYVGPWIMIDKCKVISAVAVKGKRYLEVWEFAPDKSAKRQLYIHTSTTKPQRIK